MSPICPAKAMATDRTTSQTVPKPASQNPRPTSAAPPQPATVPVQVFFGLIAGQNFGPPAIRPTK